MSLQGAVYVILQPLRIAGIPSTGITGYYATTLTALSGVKYRD